MHDEDVLRSGLRTLAKRAPTGGDAVAVRRLGHRRRRIRRAGQLGALTVILAAAGIGGSASIRSADDASAIEAAGSQPDSSANPTGQPTTTTMQTTTIPTTTTIESHRNRSTLPPQLEPEPQESEGRETTTPTTNNLPEDPSAPTPAAIAADEAFRRRPSGYQDCGSLWTTSGYPTTTVPLPDLTQCIAEAFVQGSASQFSFSARNFSGGSVGAIYRVNPDGSAEEITYTVDPAGEVDSNTVPCTELLASSSSPPWEPDCRS